MLLTCFDSDTLNSENTESQLSRNHEEHEHDLLIISDVSYDILQSISVTSIICRTNHELWLPNNSAMFLFRR